MQHVIPLAPPALPTDAPPCAPLSTSLDTADWKLQVVRHVLALAASRNLSERAAALAVIETATAPNGKPIKLRALQGWIKAAKRDGAAALVRKRRSDAGAPKVAITEAWDTFMLSSGVPVVVMAEIAVAVDRALAELYQARQITDAKAAALVRPDLMALTAEVVPDLTPEALRRICKITAHRAKALRERNRLVATFDLDKQAFSDKYDARIQRERAGLLPMQWVAADVHTLDVKAPGPDGKMVYPKIVAWQCLATNCLWLDIYFRPIRRREIIESFCRMCAIWCVPSNIYLDNGTEYKAMHLARDLLQLKQFADRDVKVFDPATAPPNITLLHSLPRAPQGKYIEPLFKALETWSRSIQGYVGGIREKAKTDVLGEKPTGYTGSHAEFMAEWKALRTLYHDTPQRGHLAGKTPFEALQAHIDAGWQRDVLNPRHAEIAFATVERRKVQNGGEIALNNEWWHDHNPDREALFAFSDQYIEIRVPLVGDGSRVFAMQADGMTEICALVRKPTYSAFDPRGTKDQKRRHDARIAWVERHRIEPTRTMGERLERAAAIVPVPSAPIRAELHIDRYKALADDAEVMELLTWAR